MSRDAALSRRDRLRRIAVAAGALVALGAGWALVLWLLVMGWSAGA